MRIGLLHRGPLVGLPVLCLLGLVACGEPETDPGNAGGEVTAPALQVDDPNPPHARWDVLEEFRQDVKAPRHGSDGGGSASLDWGPEGPPPIHAGRPASFDLRYRAGPLGIAEGGQIHFMPEPFWGWSVPQNERPDGPGFTRVSTDAEGVELNAFRVQSYLVVEVAGRALREGEEVRFEYGAGPLGALVDRHAERDAHLWVYVDGDGDGIRDLLLDSPTVDVLPGPAARLVATTPSVVRPGDTLVLNLALLDVYGNDGVEFEGTVAIGNRPPSWDVPETVEFQLQDRGRKRIEITAPSPGVVRLSASVELDGETARAEAGPTWVDADAPLVFWGDLHGHSNYSDGTGRPEDWYEYARDTAALDFVALTDHDHFGVRFIDRYTDLWEDLCAQAASHHEPGRFVTLLGYEWTSWIHGHRHVLFFGDEAQLYSSVDEQYETPRQLWDALRGQDVLTFAHHSAGDPIPTNWTFRPDPILEPVTEVMSVHGSSEAADSPRILRNARAGNFVRDVLNQGVPLGFIGSGDSHDGHPGLPHLSPVYGWTPGRGEDGREHLGTGGLAAVRASDLSRKSLLSALRARDCYATSGPRIYLQTTLGGKPMGSTLTLEDLGESPTMRVVLLGTAGLTRMDLIRSGQVQSMLMDGERRFLGELPLEGLQQGEYLYLRVHQADGGLAWSSPYFIE